MTGSVRQQSIATSYGWVRVIGRSKPIVDAVLRECGDGVSLPRAAGASVERVIEQAERMNQNAEMN